MIFLKKKIIFLVVLGMLFVSFQGNAITNQENSYIVMEKSTSRILEGANIHKQMLVASTAKILTAITVIENYKLDETITITAKDTSEVGSKVYLKETEEIKRLDLLYALMLRSANDAASALSENNSPDFIYKMNELAKKIGMKNSVFQNASGLDEKEYNLSTAYDMALLSAYASSNDTFKTIASSHSYICKTNLGSYTWTNKHKLVSSDNAFIWGKTGYTKKSKRILVSNYLMDNKNLIIVTINDSNDWNHHRALATNTERYDFITIFKKGVYNTGLDVTYYLHIKEDITIPLKKSEKEELGLVFKLYKKTALLVVYLKKEIIMSKQIDVYDKENFDLDIVIFDV